MAKQNASQQKVIFQETIAKLKAEQYEGASFQPYPIPIPWFVPNSGLYTYLILNPIGPQPSHPPMIPTAGQGLEDASEMIELSPTLPISPFFLNEELRLDVDGYFPQMKASGSVSGRKIMPAYWIANVKKTKANTYEGAIWYKEGNVAVLPFTTVKIEVARTLFSPKTAKVTFSGVGASDKVCTFNYKSRYFHPVNFEFDTAEGVSPVLTNDTCSHPNRPASLLCENLSIATVYRRAGFDVTISGAGDVVPIAEAGADAKWSDAEMHDAMQIHWSKFANAPQWALWTFFASLHEMGPSLGGIMFDDIGPKHRQGTSLFVDSFIKNSPAGDPAPPAWVNRMIFWTACHEMGHSFNLAHSWQKSYGVQWIPLTNEPLARSFMNYPYNVPGGTSAFFSDFEFRFSDGELLFMRHAPFRFVQQGNADWFDHHGFQQANISPEPKFSLSIECAGNKKEFEFLEPVVVHLTLKNTSDQPQLVDEKLLCSTDRMTIIIKKRGKPAREFISYAQRCWKENSVILKPGAEMKDSVFLVGRNGWDLAEPGYYTVQASIDVFGEDIISKPVTVRVAPPKGYEEEHVAQDFFTEDVGRVLNFDGSRYMKEANKVLHDVVERLPKSRATIHAKVALGNPLISAYKEVEFLEHTHSLILGKAKSEEANELLSVLLEDPRASASTLGQVDYDYYCDRFKPLLEEARKGARKR